MEVNFPIKECQRCGKTISVFSEDSNYYRHISVKYCDVCRPIVNREKNNERVKKFKKKKKVDGVINQNYIVIDGFRLPTKVACRAMDGEYGHCVYWFTHPNQKWVYVGKSDGNLRNRILSHKRGIGDNIDAKFKQLIDESDVYYVRLSNSTESDFVESILINQHNPVANIMKKHDEHSIEIELNLNWKKYKL